MLASAFDLGEQISLQSLNYVLYRPLWDRYTIVPQHDLSFVHWNKIKYLNDTGTDFNALIEQVPNNTGGLYMFFIKCNIIPGITEYPFYIGRAQFTQSQNLRKRVREYFTKYSKGDERPKITKMFRYWASELHLAYFTLNDNDDIIDLEKNLINSLLLPMNDSIPDTEVSQAVKAF